MKKEEQHVFHKMREQLKKDYPGKYVAIYKQRVVDSDENVSVLIDRFYKKYGKVVVCISKPEEHETIQEILTPL